MKVIILCVFGEKIYQTVRNQFENTCFDMILIFSELRSVLVLPWSILVKGMSHRQGSHTTGVALVESCALQMFSVVCALELWEKIGSFVYSDIFGASSTFQALF